MPAMVTLAGECVDGGVLRVWTQGLLDRTCETRVRCRDSIRVRKSGTDVAIEHQRALGDAPKLRQHCRIVLVIVQQLRLEMRSHDAVVRSLQDGAARQLSLDRKIKVIRLWGPGGFRTLPPRNRRSV